MIKRKSQVVEIPEEVIRESGDDSQRMIHSELARELEALHVFNNSLVKNFPGLDKTVKSKAPMETIKEKVVFDKDGKIVDPRTKNDGD